MCNNYFTLCMCVVYSCEGSPHKDPLLSGANGDSPRLQNSGDIVYFYQGTQPSSSQCHVLITLSDDGRAFVSGCL